jgi:hypothetical protein
MTVFYDIQAALNQQLNTMPSAPPIAWPNTNYEPAVGTLWLRPTLLPADSEVATLGAGGSDENIGIYIIDIFAPLGDGHLEAYQMADTVANRFKTDTELTYNGRTVWCMSASIAAATREENWWQVPVRIAYLSYTAKR